MTKLVSLKSQVATNNKLTTIFICRVHKAKQDQEAHLDPGDFRQEIVKYWLRVYLLRRKDE